MNGSSAGPNRQLSAEAGEGEHELVDLTGLSDDEVLEVVGGEEEDSSSTVADRDLYPSRVVDDYWVFAYNLSGYVQPDTPRSGKWLIFVPFRLLDETWRIIKEDTEEGLLGVCSKAATARENPNAANRNVKVICVYTYDADDYDDVVRVRERLKFRNFVAPLNYKTDEATRVGQYAHTGATRVSKYRM